MFLTDKPPSKVQCLPPSLAVCLVRVSTWASEKGIGREARRKREKERESREGSEREDLRAWLLWSDFVCVYSKRERESHEKHPSQGQQCKPACLHAFAALCTVPACNFMLEQHARNLLHTSFFLFYFETMEFSKVKCIKSSHFNLLQHSFVWLTHFTIDDRNRHLTAHRICPVLRVYSLTRVVHYSSHKSHLEPGVCTSACGSSVFFFHMMWPVVLH